MADDYAAEVAEMEAIARREPDAFERWFARSEVRLRQSLRSFAAVVDVEAVVQDTAIRVWTFAPRITPDGRPGFLYRWARTVALNDARNTAKRNGRSVAIEAHPEAEGTTAGEAGDPMLRDRIRHCFDQLPDDHRRAFAATLDAGGQRQGRDLAALIDMTYAAFRQNLSRGRRALEQCLRKAGIDVREYCR